MKLRQFLDRLGLAESRPAPAAPAPPERPDTREYGATGTPIFGGFLRDLGEYNQALGGLAAFTTYEKMRRSDAQVAATLAGMKLPIRSADWAIVEPQNASPVEREAAEFARQCLFEEIDFDGAIENALLMLDFGCAAHEDVWYVDGNRVRLRKLAPRLPVTFQRWIVEPGTDELLAIEQYGARGDTYVTATVPAQKLALFTFQREGSNFAGRSVLRPMYQHWYIKSNLYKIDAIAHERNGMGIPWIQMGPDAKVEDRKAAREWLQKLCVHENAALVLPPQWLFSLEGVKGTTRSAKDAIAHHNLMISMAGLAQFMMLGQSESGNRALGETMGDFFYLSLQATAKLIARAFNLGTLKRLVDLNFRVQRYPQLVAQQILSIRFESLVDALQKLATGGAIEPDDELEHWLRKKLGAPDKGQPRPMPPALAAQRLAESEGLKLSRAPRGAERFLALREIVSELDRGRDAIAAALRRARSAVQAEIVHKVVAAPIATMHRVSVQPDAKLVAQIEAVLRDIQEFAARQVERERAAQRAGKEPSGAAEIRAADRRRGNREPLGVYADAVVAEFFNTLTQRAVNVALDWRRRPGDLTPGEVIRRIEDELDEQSDKWIEGAASKPVNEVFADGRAEGYERYADEIVEVQYSALLDINTCGNCAAADGATGATPDDVPAVPNPDCDGGDRCRCVHVYVFGDEVRQ